MRKGRSTVILVTAATGIVACGGDDTIGFAPLDGSIDVTTITFTPPTRADGGGDDGGPDATVDAGDAREAGDDATQDGAPPDTSTGDAAPPTDAGEAGPHGARASIAATSVSFGAVPCGGAAPPNQSILVANLGDAPLTVNAALASGTTFSLLSPAQASVGAQSSISVTLSARAVASTAAAGATSTDTLTIQTNDPAQPTFTLPVSLTPSGASLVLQPATAAFGTRAVGVGTSFLPLSLVNVGNAPVTFAIGQPSDPEFGITYANAPNAVTLAAGGAVTGLQATFAPTTVGPASSSVAITPVAGSVFCGASAASIPLTGQGGTTGVSVSPGTLDFGPVACGGSAKPLAITVTNTGQVPFGVSSVALAKGASSPFVARAPGGPIAAGASGSITVTPAAIPTISPVPGDYGDTLTFRTDIPNDAPHVVPLTMSASGAILSFDTAALPFGAVPVATTKSATLNVINGGDATAGVTLVVAGSAYSVSPSTSFALPAGTKQGATVTFAPTANGSVAGSVALSTTGAICQPLPPPIALSGTGQGGALTTSVASLDFGDVPCGGAAAAKSFTITNAGGASLTWSASLGGAGFTASPSSGSLGAGGSATITVTPRAIPSVASVAADAFADTLTITTSLSGDAPHAVKLHESATGAILSLAPTSIHFGSIPVQTTATSAFQVQNTGTLAAHVSVTPSNPAFGVTGSPSLVAAGGATPLQASFAPGASNAAQSGSLVVSVAPGDALCAPLPSPLFVDGTGTNGTVSIAPASLSFGAPNCGSQAGPQQVTLTNPGNEDYAVTSATLGQGASSMFTVAMSPASGVVPHGGAGGVVLTVTPRPIPVPSPTGAAIYGDTLTVTTNAAGDAPHAIPLVMGAQGAVLAVSTNAVNFGSVPVGATGVSSLTVTNSGNASVSVGFGAIGSSVFAFDQATSLAANQSIAPNGYFTPAAAQGYSASAQLTVPQGTALCASLPGPISLSGVGTNDATTSVTPSSLSFGNVLCGGAAAGARSVVVKSVANAPKPLAFALENGAWYTVTSAPSNATSIAANGGTVTLTVTPKAIPVAVATQVGGVPYGDVLDVTVGGSTTYVPLAMSAAGAVLAWNPVSITAPRGATTNFLVSNSGNLSAGIALASDNGSFVLSPQTGSAAIGSSSWSIADNATSAQTAHVTMSLLAGATICQPLPGALVVTGQ